MKNLTVPYKSQWDADANQTQSDCGPASAAMILQYYGVNVTTDEFYAKTKAGKGVIPVQLILNAIGEYGFKCAYYTNKSIDSLKSYIDRDIPVIALVHYGDFSSRQDKRYVGGHFFTVVGYRDDGVFVNDPDFWDKYRGDGDHHFYTWDEFTKGWSNCGQDTNPNNSFIVIFRKEEENTIKILKSQFEELVRKSTVADKVGEILKKEINLDVIVGEVKRLVTLEDQVIEKDRKISELQVAHDELHNQLVSVTAKYVALSDQHDETVTQLNDLTEKTKTNSKKMEEMGDTIKAMTDQIKNLHDQIATPIFTGWKSIVQKIVNFLLKTL